MTGTWRLAAGIVAVATVASAQAVIAPNAVEFDEYGEVAQSLTGVPGNPDAGKEVMATRSLGNCVACHQVTAMADVPFHGDVGPSLDGVADRWSEAQLRGIVIDADRTFPDSIMPAFYKTDGFTRPGDGYTGKAAPADLPPILSAQQVEDVVAYLMTLHDE
ncbi:sulfur oxidation c-type cytochrome SoxX [Rubellimicrobium sp. CFH 75288]|uniref:sulfur oxidation c-type cytochrome SoxX n=1 Tax=Rubellimicrobium sp. CFH 75288 TaxID=2697034 RepID=UPI001412B5B2|nr:sulfur oxidation c-type cytochrome SoxX [Rubellimicrobium sp. CFH 75288]NAZ35685.1 sulfur oxidation c-type cytochrome SoxX [Rubellimicrobium sp. CFH 75288]